LRDQGSTSRENVERLGKESGIEIQLIRKRNVRKEDLVEALLATRGRQPGLVAILSAMERCATYQVVPVAAVLCQSRSLDAKHSTDFAGADLRDQALKSGTLHQTGPVRARSSLITVTFRKPRQRTDSFPPFGRGFDSHRPRFCA
jgi:hypothetical protein